MPLGGPWNTIHPRWSQHHRPTATGTLTATCIITRATGAGTTDTTTGVWTPAARTTIYTGPCRLLVAQIIGGEKVQETGAAQETSRRYRVTIEWDAADPLVGDDIEITSAQDPHLAGKHLRVATVDHAAEQWQRDMIAWEVEAIR